MNFFLSKFLVRRIDHEIKMFCSFGMVRRRENEFVLI